MRGRVFCYHRFLPERQDDSAQFGDETQTEISFNSDDEPSFHEQEFYAFCLLLREDALKSFRFAKSRPYFESLFNNFCLIAGTWAYVYPRKY